MSGTVHRCVSSGIFSFVTHTHTHGSTHTGTGLTNVQFRECVCVRVYIFRFLVTAVGTLQVTTDDTYCSSPWVLKL